MKNRIYQIISKSNLTKYLKINLMQDFIKPQFLLLRWIRHFGVRSHEQVRSASKSLCASFKIDPHHSILKLLYPLLRLGLVEFIGEGRYQATSPLLIFYPKKQVIVGLNLSNEQKNRLTEKEFDEDSYGIIRFKGEIDDAKSIAILLECTLDIYTQENSLANFPSIKSVVLSFNDDILFKSNWLFYNLSTYKWSSGNKGFGICKGGEDSYVYFIKLSEKDFRKIPSEKYNPEGRILAECYQQIYEAGSLFHYDEEKRTLTFNQTRIPILVERILRKSSLYNKSQMDENSINTHCFTDITKSTYKQLRRIYKK